MFNEDKAIKLHYNGEILGCIRVVRFPKAKGGNTALTLAVFVAADVLWDDEVYDRLIAAAVDVAQCLRKSSSPRPQLIIPRLQTTALDRYSNSLMTDQ